MKKTGMYDVVPYKGNQTIPGLDPWTMKECTPCALNGRHSFYIQKRMWSVYFEVHNGRRLRLRQVRRGVWKIVPRRRKRGSYLIMDEENVAAAREHFYPIREYRRGKTYIEEMGFDDPKTNETFHYLFWKDKCGRWKCC